MASYDTQHLHFLDVCNIPPKKRLRPMSRDGRKKEKDLYKHHATCLDELIRPKLCVDLHAAKSF